MPAGRPRYTKISPRGKVRLATAKLQVFKAEQRYAGCKQHFMKYYCELILIHDNFLNRVIDEEVYHLKPEG